MVELWLLLIIEPGEEVEHGHYVVHGKFVACSQGPPAAFVVQIRAHGPLRL